MLVAIADTEGTGPIRHSTMYQSYLSSRTVSNSIWDTTENKKKFDKYVCVVLNYVKRTCGFREGCLQSISSDNFLFQNVAIIKNCVLGIRE